MRFLKISFVFLKYFAFSGRSGFGKKFRLVSEELGPVFVKIGQMLSTRYEILEKEDCKELQKLLDNVAPFPFEEIERIFKNEFRALPSEIFFEFPEVPIASASMSQVYKAKLSDGSIVAVKVKRPGIKRKIKSDMAVLKKLVWIAELFSSDLRHIRPREILRQMEEWFDTETDFRQELKNIKTLKRYYSDWAKRKDGGPIRNIMIPSVYTDLSSANVITMDFIEGIPVSKCEGIADNHEYDTYGSLINYGITQLRPYLDDETCLFHADPHPANILIQKGGKVGLLDFGLIGKMGKKEAKETKDLFMSVYAKNFEKTLSGAFTLSGIPRENCSDKLKEEIREYLYKTETEGVGFWFLGLVRIFIKHRIPLPYQLVLFGRTNAILDGVVNIVAPNKSTLDLIGPELERALRKRMINNILNTDFRPLIYTLSEKIKESPEILTKAADRYLNSPFLLFEDFKKAFV